MNNYIFLFCISTILIYIKSIFQSNLLIDSILIISFFGLIISLFYSWFKIIRFFQKNKQLRIQIFIFIISYLVSLTRITSLFLARLFQNKSGLIFNVDLAHSLTHANTIARFGNLKTSLSFSGSQVNYHAGPAYFSGLLDKYFHVPVEITSLIIIPVLAFTAFIYSFYFISISQNNNFLTWSLMSLSCFIPDMFLVSNLFLELPKFSSLSLNYMTSQPFQANLMQNSMWAGSGLFSAISLVLIRNSKNNLLFSYIIVLSLFAIKPAYCISGLPIFLCIIFCLKRYEQILSNINQNISYFYLISFSFISLIWFRLSKTFLSASNTQINLMQLKYFLNNDFDDYGIFIDKNFLIIIIISLFFIYIKIKNPNYFNFIESSNKNINYKKLIIILLFLYPTFHIICILFPLNTFIDFDLMKNPKTEFFQNNNFEFSGYGSIIHYNLQTLIPIKDFLKIILLVFLASYFSKDNKHSFLRENINIRNKKSSLNLFSAFSLLNIFLNIIFTFDIVNNPKSKFAYESVDESALRRILKKIPEEKVKIITNELGYPQDNFRRNYTGTSLTSFSKHQYYLTNLRYERQYMHKNAFRKYVDHKSFFNKNLSEQNIDFLTKNNISHILIRKISPNQPTYWINDKNVNKYFFEIAENKEWIIYKLKKRYRK